MNLKDFATPIKARNHFMKVGIGGFSGTGKTRTASEFIEGLYKDLKIDKPLLFIDNEKGSRFLAPFFQKRGIEVILKETTHLADVHQAINYLNNGDIGALFIDSLTKVYYQFVRDYKKANNVKVMQLNDWGKILPAWQEQFSDKFVECEGNFIFTGRGGYEYSLEEDEKTKKKSFNKSGVKMKLAGETPFEPDLNIWMDRIEEMKGKTLTVWREATIMKDRSDTIDGQVFKNPTYENFKPVVAFLCSVPTGDVAGATETTNLAPDESGASEYYKRRTQKEIELDKLKDLFVEYDLGGTSQEQKKLKIAISKKILGTSSATEIETFDAGFIQSGRQDAEKMLMEMKEMEDKKIEGFSKEEFIKNFKVVRLNSPDDLLAEEVVEEAKEN